MERRIDKVESYCNVIDSNVRICHEDLMKALDTIDDLKEQVKALVYTVNVQDSRINVLVKRLKTPDPKGLPILCDLINQRFTQEPIPKQGKIVINRKGKLLVSKNGFIISGMINGEEVTYRSNKGCMFKPVIDDKLGKGMKSFKAPDGVMYQCREDKEEVYELRTRFAQCEFGHLPNGYSPNTVCKSVEDWKRWNPQFNYDVDPRAVNGEDWIKIQIVLHAMSRDEYRDYLSKLYTACEEQDDHTLYSKESYNSFMKRVIGRMSKISI